MVTEGTHRGVRLFKIFNVASSNLMFFVLGVVLFSSTVLLPQFLQTLMGYTAEAAGMVLSGAAILLLFRFTASWPTAGAIPGPLPTGVRVDHTGSSSPW